MFDSLAAAQKYIQENGIQVVDLKYTDLWGGWHHITIPAHRLDDALMAEGVGFDASSVGFRSVKSGDMVLIPDLDTGMIDPFWDLPTLSFTSTAYEADTRAMYPHDPRNIARKAEEYMRETGIADRSIWGPEFEFYIFNAVRFENFMNRAGYRIYSEEANWDTSTESDGYFNALHGGYHAAPPRDRHFNLRAEIIQVLEEMGVPVKYDHHEVGGPGQMEIETPLMGLVQSGDAAMLIKYATKMAAQRAGLTATFMPKPLYGEAGNGMHFHQLLTLEGRNLFYDPGRYGNLSRTAFHYIAGLLCHGRALLAITNPITNSYKRLVPGFEAPVNAFFSLGNRSAAIRIPRYANKPESTRIEFRPPDAACNAYLALAAQLMAGLDGIQRQLDPTELGFGPIDANIFDWTSSEREQIISLPGSLEDALQALEADHDFLLAGGVFNKELIEKWVSHKREKEICEIRNRPHPYEIEQYYDV